MKRLLFSFALFFLPFLARSQVQVYIPDLHFSATSRIAGRATAGAGAGEELTATAVLDLIGSTRGSILERGSGGWVIVTPGTAGQPLVSAGSGADPIYTNDLSNSTGIKVHGTNTNDDAPSGYDGEYVFSAATTGSVSLTSGADANITSLVSLPAGDWDISGSIRFTPAASSIPTFILSCVTTTSATNSSNIDSMTLLQATMITGAEEFQVTPTKRFSFSTATTVFLVGHCNFTVSTCTAGGIIRARRVR